MQENLGDYRQSYRADADNPNTGYAIQSWLGWGRRRHKLRTCCEHALLTIGSEDSEDETLHGSQAARLGYVTWSVPASDINKEMGRTLNQLREKSAVALRLTKASVRLGQAEQLTPLEALQHINTFYITEVMRTKDAAEGLRAFLEKRQPQWSGE